MIAAVFLHAVERKFKHVDELWCLRNGLESCIKVVVVVKESSACSVGELSHRLLLDARGALTVLLDLCWISSSQVVAGGKGGGVQPACINRVDGHVRPRREIQQLRLRVSRSFLDRKE